MVCVYVKRNGPSLTVCRAARAREMQERDSIYIEPSSEAAYEKQRSSKILLNRGTARDWQNPNGA